MFEFAFLYINLAASNIKVNNDVKCLAQAVYHEARGESIEGQLAVARSILNRKYHAEYPDTICKVVYQKGQYEYTWKVKKSKIKYDTKSLKIAKTAIAERNSINKLIANEIEVDIPLKNATSFNQQGFKNPRLKFVKKIGAHKFYKIKKPKKVSS